MRESIVHSDYRVDVLPANVELAGAEVELAGMERRETRLRDALTEVEHDYDYVFIDCPPSLGFLTLNALAAAHSVLIPIQCEFYALEGVAQLMNTISLVQESANPALGVQGVVMTMYDGRTRIATQVVDMSIVLSMPKPLVAFPCGSMSTSRTRRLARATAAARFTAVVVLPTPPF